MFDRKRSFNVFVLFHLPLEFPGFGPVRIHLKLVQDGWKPHTADLNPTSSLEPNPDQLNPRYSETHRQQTNACCIPGFLGWLVTQHFYCNGWHIYISRTRNRKSKGLSYFSKTIQRLSSDFSITAITLFLKDGCQNPFYMLFQNMTLPQWEGRYTTPAL